MLLDFFAAVITSSHLWNNVSSRQGLYRGVTVCFCGCCCPPSWAKRLVASLRAQYLIESWFPSVSQQSLKWLFAQHVCPFPLINSYQAKRNVLPCLSCYIRALQSFPLSEWVFSHRSKNTEIQSREFIYI